MTGLQSKHRWQIRRIFLAPRERYSVKQAAAVLGISRQALHASVRNGTHEAAEEAGTTYLPWSQVASLAMEQWPLPTIYEDLGEEVWKALPPLLQPRVVTFTLPDYQLRMLQVLAKRGGKEVHAFLCDHLLDLAESEASGLETEIPGFRAALLYPDEPTEES